MQISGTLNLNPALQVEFYFLPSSNDSFFYFFDSSYSNADDSISLIFNGPSNVGIVFNWISIALSPQFSGGIHSTTGGSDVYVHLTSTPSACSNTNWITNNHFCFYNESTDFRRFYSIVEITVEGSYPFPIDFYNTYHNLLISGLDSSSQVILHFYSSLMSDLTIKNVIAEIDYYGSLSSMSISILNLELNSKFTVTSKVKILTLSCASAPIFRTLTSNNLANIDNLLINIENILQLLILTNGFYIQLQSGYDFTINLSNSLKKIYLNISSTSFLTVPVSCNSTIISYNSRLFILASLGINFIKGIRFSSSYYNQITVIGDSSIISIDPELPNFTISEFTYVFQIGQGSTAPSCSKGIVLPNPDNECHFEDLMDLPKIYHPGTAPYRVIYIVESNATVDLLDLSPQARVTVLPSKSGAIKGKLTFISGSIGAFTLHSLRILNPTSILSNTNSLSLTLLDNIVIEAPVDFSTTGTYFSSFSFKAWIYSGSLSGLSTVDWLSTVSEFIISEKPLQLYYDIYNTTTVYLYAVDNDGLVINFRNLPVTFDLQINDFSVFEIKSFSINSN